MNNLPDTTSPFEVVPAATQAPAPSPWEQHGHHMREWFDLFQGSWKAAEVLAATDFVPDAWKGKPHSVAAAMMKGYEMGITPIDALANMHVIKGKIGFAAEYMRRRIIESGHEYVIEESTETRCRIRARRKGGEEWQQFTFTADQAKKARIDLGSYPADKLVARASSRMCRYMFPEVLNGFALSEDLEDLDEPAPAPVQATAQRSAPAARKTARRSAPSRAVESAKSQAPAPAEEGSGQAVSAG
ncbi:hypothetical protein G6019_02600, partial [Dietzia sp. DQ12-76]|nr:hypothetical protein [Dietzia sp. DQ12-76]